MGFTLALRKVASISECVRKEIITYVEHITVDGKGRLCL